MARYLVLVRWYRANGDIFDVRPYDSIKDAMGFIREVVKEDKGQAILIEADRINVVKGLLTRRW